MVEKTKEKVPGFSQGVRRNAAVRMIKMVQPICPNSKLDMIRTPEGRYIPNPEANPAKQNCQMDRDENGNARIGWWDSCAERGHDPYVTTRVWYSKEDVFDPETNEKTGERTIRHTTARPNIVQVAAHLRVNSGKGPLVKQRASGFKRLSEAGYEEVCQFRNCQKPVTVTSAVGEYCGKDHAMLCAADWFGVVQDQTLTNPAAARLIDEGYESRARTKQRQSEAEALGVAEIRALK